MPQRLRINFKGHVQGVGFRWTTRNIASGFDVGGWVKNLPGGDVEVVVEGEKKEVDAFLGELRSRMGNFIRGESIQKQPPTGDKYDFRVAY